jgi:putative tryptophan/tyrosine transport system permease protein
MSPTVLLSLLSDASIYLGLSLGLWLSFRILGYPDLALEQLFVLGGVIYAVCVSSGQSITSLVLVTVIVSLSLGFLCSTIRNRFHVHPILISLAAAYAYYSIALITLDGPSRFLGTYVSSPSMGTASGVALAIFGGATLLLELLARRPIGLKVVAVGSNPDLARRHGLSPTLWQGFGLAVSFLLVMTSGILFTWRTGNIDVSYGSGLLLVTIFVVVLTRAVHARIRIWLNSVLLAFFLLSYLTIVQAALSFGMPPQWLRGATALVFLTMVIVLPKANGITLRI